MPLDPDRKNQPFDEVEKASHYNQGEIEAIDALEDWELDYHSATAVAYIIRHMHKGTPIKDLRKAVWYLNRRIKYLQKKFEKQKAAAM